MSVVKSKQGENKLEVQNKADKLSGYIAQLCQSEKKFCPSDGINYCWLGNRMNACAMDILCAVRMANRMERADGGRERMQLTALSQTERLLCLGQKAYEWGILKSKQVKYLTALTGEVRDLISKWRKSDREILKKQSLAD